MWDKLIVLGVSMVGTALYLYHRKKGQDEISAGRMGILYVVFTCLVMAVAWSFMAAVTKLEEGNSSESKDQLERTLRRAIAAEYAQSGAYPESLDAIVSKYGIQIDTDRFDVFYMPVAENLAPELDVIDNGDVREGGSLR